MIPYIYGVRTLAKKLGVTRDNIRDTITKYRLEPKKRMKNGVLNHVFTPKMQKEIVWRLNEKKTARGTRPSKCR